MRAGHFISLFFVILCLVNWCTPVLAESEKPMSFSWVNLPTEDLPAGVSHGSFKSGSMGVGVGYCIYLPPGYETETEQRYPVVYHLHGGRPGSELKSVGLTAYVDRAIRAGEISPTIYVFPNGGPMSWYNWVGTKGFNYESNLKFSEYLGQLGVAHEKLIAEGVAHSAKQIDAMRGGELMKFHQRNFSR